MSNAQNIADNGIAEINACGNTQDLELIKARYMGKTGSLRLYASFPERIKRSS